MSHRNLMPIGRFARSCRLSVKALRHYDELGLLKPAFVDPQSRYRYYSREQARDALMVGMLRSLDLPLEVIRRALGADSDELKQIIDAQAARIEAELAQRQSALLSLRQLSQMGELASYEVLVRRHPARRIARLRGTSTAAGLIADTTELVYALLDEVNRVPVSPHEPVFVINRFCPGGDVVELEACIEIEGEGSALQRAEPVRISDGTFASLMHIGPYETLGIAHNALIAWMQERGHEMDAAGDPPGIWEFYRNDPAAVSREVLETEIAIPLAWDD